MDVGIIQDCRAVQALLDVRQDRSVQLEDKDPSEGWEEKVLNVWPVNFPSGKQI